MTKYDDGRRFAKQVMLFCFSVASLLQLELKTLQMPSSTRLKDRKFVVYGPGTSHVSNGSFGVIYFATLPSVSLFCHISLSSKDMVISKSFVLKVVNTVLYVYCPLSSQ